MPLFVTSRSRTDNETDTDWFEFLGSGTQVSACMEISLFVLPNWQVIQRPGLDVMDCRYDSTLMATSYEPIDIIKSDYTATNSK